MIFSSNVTLTLAQEALPPKPGESTPGNTAVPPAGATGTPGAAPAGGGAAPGGPDQIFLILLLVVGGMILFSILGQRRDRKKRDSMISAIKKHDRVQTIGGVIGSVVEVKPDYIVLKVDETSNTRITFARSAVQQVLSVSPETSSAGAGDSAAKAEN